MTTYNFAYIIRATLVLIILSICFSCKGQANKPYTFNDNGTKYTLTIEEMRPEIQNQLLAMSQQLNSQSPLIVDEITTLMSTVVIGSEVQHNYRINIDSSTMPEEQKLQFASSMKMKQGKSMKYLMVDANIDLMPREEWIRLYKELGVKFTYNMRDNQGIVFGQVIVDYKDF